MSKNRMAGSDEFKQKLSVADRNARARARIAANPELSAEKYARIPDEYKNKGFNEKEMIMAFQGDGFNEVDFARLGGQSSNAPIKAPKSMPEEPANDIGNGPGRDRPLIGMPVMEAPITRMSVQLPIMEETPTMIIGGETGSFNAGNIDANIGKQGDMITNINDSTFGDYANIGNDYSQTSGSMMFGNSLSLPRRRIAEDGAFSGLRLI